MPQQGAYQREWQRSAYPKPPAAQYKPCVRAETTPDDWDTVSDIRRGYKATVPWPSASNVATTSKVAVSGVN